MGAVSDVSHANLTNGVKFTSRSFSSSTANPGDLTGASTVIVDNVGATPGTLTPRTAAQMISDDNLVVGQTWLLILNNDQATGTLTLGTAAGVTVSGAATAAGNAATWFMAQVTAANTIVFTRLFTMITAA